MIFPFIPTWTFEVHVRTPVWCSRWALDAFVLQGRSFLHWFILGYELSSARIISNQMLKTNTIKGNFDEEMVELFRYRKWIDFHQKNPQTNNTKTNKTPQTNKQNWWQTLALSFVYFLNRWILSGKNILEYFYRLFLIANLNKPYEKRSSTSVAYVWLYTKTDFNDNFTNPKWIYISK